MFTKTSFLLASAVTVLLMPALGSADEFDQAKRIHDRLAGTPPSSEVLNTMATHIKNGEPEKASYEAMKDKNFYNVTLKNMVTPWTNEEQTVFAPLNDYTATVIGIVRDDVDFREILKGDILYTGNAQGVPSYSNNSNAHYEALENNGHNLGDPSVLVANTQSAVTGLPSDATAGVMTTRAAAKAFFKDGTNRAMFRFTLLNHLCNDLEQLKDTSGSPDRIRQDVSRSPGGDSKIFLNNCLGCHAGMDPLAQAFAYYEWDYNGESDPNGLSGSLAYNGEGQLDPTTGTRVTKKHQINANNFKYGFIIENDKWDNYWRNGSNSLLGWDASLSGSGNGAKSMGEELAHSKALLSAK